MKISSAQGLNLVTTGVAAGIALYRLTLERNRSAESSSGERAPISVKTAVAAACFGLALAATAAYFSAQPKHHGPTRIPGDR